MNCSSGILIYISLVLSSAFSLPDVAAVLERERVFFPSCRVTGRCKHYMISQLETGKFVIVGEPRVHNSLEDMVKFHMKVHSHEALPPYAHSLACVIYMYNVLILFQGFSRLAVRYLCSFSSIPTKKTSHQTIINCQRFNCCSLFQGT